MKRNIIVFTLLASVLWYWIGLALVAVFVPGIIYPTMYFREVPLLWAFLAGTPVACVIGLCPAIAAGALIAAWTKNAGRFGVLKVPGIALGIALDAMLIVLLPVGFGGGSEVLFPLGFTFVGAFLTITLSWLIAQGLERPIAAVSRLASRIQAW